MSELDLGALMRQAQQLQEQMAHMQKGLDTQTVEGTAGAGMVKVTATGTQRVTAIAIDPSVLSEDREMLEDLIVAAVNEAVEASQKLASDEMGAITGGLGLDLPGLF